MAKPPYPQFPLYIPSKGRAAYMMTSRALTRMGVSHHVIVEPQEADAYREAIDRMGLLANVLVLDLAYKQGYSLLDDLGLTKSTGPGPARNFAWDHSVAQGHAWHWVMDDNIGRFLRLVENRKVPVVTSAIWRAMEDFCLRYANVAMAGPNYHFFAKRKQKIPPFITNTRIYSCNLIRNDVPFRWRGRYNEDTILSLDMLKAGWCTIQFNAFLQAKLPTQTIGGGNTDEFYRKEGKRVEDSRYAQGGTTAKSQMLVRVHPDVSTIVWKFGRVHHHVDFRPFARQKLVLRSGVRISRKPNEYGMTLKPKSEAPAPISAKQARKPRQKTGSTAQQLLDDLMP